MDTNINITNKTMELSDCRDQWTLNETFGVRCLEDILYTPRATTPKFQRLSIFAPAAYLNADGTINEAGTCGRYTARTAPVVFENASAGYMQMPHSWLGAPRDEAPKYLKRGFVYVTCGCRGRESRDQAGRLCGKSPWTLVDLKTAIRFLRHNAAVLPGDFSRIISVGTSAGGAMSSLLSVSGNNDNYLPFLAENGAFLDQGDEVFAGQIYCPIVDLDHADLAYEWQFQKDPENEASHAGPAGRFTPFQEALSQKLAAAYVEYFNSLGLKHPATGEPLTFGADGRSGTAYAYLMGLLEDSATDYLSRLQKGTLEEHFSVTDYLRGNYTTRVQFKQRSEKKDELGLHHVGGLAPVPGDGSTKNISLGDLMARPQSGGDQPALQQAPTVEKPGTDKTAWLSWDGTRARITSLDEYLSHHRRRMKPCTSFDTLSMDSGENQEFGTPEQDYLHFNVHIAGAIAALKDAFPEEYARYYPGYAAAVGDEALARRRYLINPMNFIGTGEKSHMAKHFRIHVGAQDADTAFTISMALALKLQNDGRDVEYDLIWDKPHCQADYPGEVCDWIEKIY